MQQEIWIDIPNYEGLYKISNLGNIKNCKGHIMKQTIKYGGYSYISLSKNGHQKSYAVHRLVMLSFVGSPQDSSFQVNHKDENPLNNCLDNLEYLLPSENCRYGNRLQRVEKTKKDNQNKQIYCSLDEEGINIIKIYKKAKFVIEDGYNYDAVLRASLGKYNKGTHKYKGVFWFRKEIEN